jgi:preprotein translocase subunit SecD
LLYLVLLLALFKIIPVTLTLAGIAGVILSVGMAVDANVLIFSRMREELREGKSFLVAMEEGFSRAWPSIRDGNLTTLFVSLILFWFGSSFVQGFALTLSLGIVLSMVSGIVVTRDMMRMFAGTLFERYTWLWK